MTMDTLESFLLWCTVLNGAVLLLSSAICLCLGWSRGLSRFYCRIYNLPQERLCTIGVMFIGIYKMVWITFNLIPYLSLLIMKYL